MAEYLAFSLDLPPSVNGLWRSGNGRVYSSKRYTSWVQSAGWQIKSQIGNKRIAGPVGIIAKFVRPDRRRRDIDNLFKAALDLISRLNVIDDDSQVQRIEAEWVPAGAPCQLMVISTKEVQ